VTDTDPQTAADAAERCPVPCDPDCDAICHATHSPSHKRTHHWPEDCPAAEQYDWGTSCANAAVMRLRVQRAELLTDRTRLAAELEQVRGDDAERLLSNQNKLLDHKDQVIAALRLELEQAKRTLTMPTLRQAWRNGWSDRARAVRDAVRVSDNDRDAYERAFARYMSEDPAEADKDPYRPLDGPGDPAAVPPRPADEGVTA
jgi:hypothetical protein